MNQEHFTQKEAQIIEKIKQVLNYKKIEILNNLMKSDTFCLDQINDCLLKLQLVLGQNEDSCDKQQTNKEDQYRKLLRKVPNFYLSMFKKWLTRQEYYLECKFLGQIRNSKNSKQQRFEFGDLKECFSKQHLIESKVIDLKPLFIEFLTKSAPKQIMINKKATAKNKQKYIEYIEQLLMELKERQPFKNYYSSKPSKCSRDSQKISDDHSQIHSINKKWQIESKQQSYVNKFVIISHQNFISLQQSDIRIIIFLFTLIICVFQNI